MTIRLPSSGALAVAVTAIAGILLSLAAYAVLDRERDAAQVSELTAVGDKLGKELDARLSRITEAVRVTAWLFHADVRQLDVEFVNLGQLAMDELPELTQIEWAPRVADGDREQFEAAAAAVNPGFRILDETPDGKLVPAARRPLYSPLLYAARIAATPFGYDTSAVPTQLAAIKRSIASGRPEATAPFPHVRGQRELVADEGRNAISIVQAVYEHREVNPVVAREDQVRGHVAAFLPLDALLKRIEERARELQVDVRVRDVTGGGAIPVHVRDAATWAADSGLETSDTIEVGGRQWELSVRPRATWVASSASHMPEYAFAGGSAAALALAFALSVALRNRARLRASQREMQGTKEKLDEREAYFSAVFDNTWDPLESTCRHASLSIL